MVSDFTDELVETDVRTDRIVEDAGIPIVDVPFVSVGGGLGSFVLVDPLPDKDIDVSKVRETRRTGTEEAPLHFELLVAKHHDWATTSCLTL